MRVGLLIFERGRYAVRRAAEGKRYEDVVDQAGAGEGGKLSFDADNSRQS